MDQITLYSKVGKSDKVNRAEIMPKDDGYILSILPTVAEAET